MAGANPQFRFSAKAGRTVPQPINYMLGPILQREGMISLAAGLVDQQTLPASGVARLSGEMLADEPTGRQSLQYGSTAGLPQLRQELLDYLCRLDGLTPEQLSLTADNLVVGSGSQQLLYIVTDVLVDPGDIVITAWPSYFVYTATIVSLGASVRAVDIDDGGMIPEALAELLEQLKRGGELGRVKIVYLCDYFQNPTGITLSPERRQRILEIVRSYSTADRICLLEDAAYQELSVDGPAVPPTIKSYERDNAQVVLAKTFSKPFSPGLRLGYAVLPDELVEPVLNQKGNHDFGSSNFLQHLLLRALRSGLYAEHVPMLRRQYAVKRDAMLSALETHLGAEPEGVSWTRPGGGLYVFLTLPEGMDTGRDADLFAAALDEGVLYVPGEHCYGPDPRREVPRNRIRLTFGSVDEPSIAEGVARLARAIKKVAGKRAPGLGHRTVSETP